MELENFCEKSACPKCGHDKVAVKHCKGCVWSGGGCPSEMSGSYEEHLDRTCERCGYVWAQAVLGQKPDGCERIESDERKTFTANEI